MRHFPSSIYPLFKQRYSPELILPSPFCPSFLQFGPHPTTKPTPHSIRLSMFVVANFLCLLCWPILFFPSIHFQFDGKSANFVGNLESFGHLFVNYFPSNLHIFANNFGTLFRFIPQHFPICPTNLWWKCECGNDRRSNGRKYLFCANISKAKWHRKFQ